MVDQLSPQSWPFKQALNVVRHVAKTRLTGDERKDAIALIQAGKIDQAITAFPALASRPVVFQTGYGPSGAPHIGTFAEVVRTSWVQNAFRTLTGDRLETRLYVFSDDMDGFRKRPDHLPEWMDEDLGRPLSMVRDPDGVYDSFAHANNTRLRQFIADLDIPHTFISATASYDSGRFDDALLRVFDRHDDILKIILPTLGEERQQTYCAFMPLTHEGQLLQSGVRLSDEHRGLLLYDDQFGCQTGNVVTGGNAKLQWKVDWAMRWYALGVDYEMSGKDLIESVKLATQIVRVLGGEPPAQMTYEMFLAEDGSKISKTKGNGLSIEQWLRYGTRESLSFYMFGNPTAAKKLHVGVIPRAQDDYLEALTEYAAAKILRKTVQDGEIVSTIEPASGTAVQMDSPVWHVHGGNPPAPIGSDITMGLLLNMAAVSRASDWQTLWAYLEQNRTVADEDRMRVNDLIQGAIRYSVDQVYPNAKFRKATKLEKVALIYLEEALREMGPGLDAEAYQATVYQVGKDNGYADDLKGWFRVIYETVFGAEEGPRIGAFILAAGLDQFCKLLDQVGWREPYEPQTQREKLAWVIARREYGEDCPSPHEGMPPSVWSSFLDSADKELANA